jgi:hypothetical protein
MQAADALGYHVPSPVGTGGFEFSSLRDPEFERIALKCLLSNKITIYCLPSSSLSSRLRSSLASGNCYKSLTFFLPILGLPYPKLISEVRGKEVSIEMLYLYIRRPKHKLGIDYTKWTKVQSEAGTIQSRDKLQKTPGPVLCGVGWMTRTGFWKGQ